MPNYQIEITVARPIEVVFDLLADIAAYPTWLPPSNTFGTIREVAPVPVQRGTTYVDAVQGPPMRGEVFAFEQPTKLGFRQTSEVGFASLKASLTSESLYTLTAQDGVTHILRDYTLTTTGPLRLLEARLARSGYAESQRILQTVKVHLEQ